MIKFLTLALLCLGVVACTYEEPPAPANTPVVVQPPPNATVVVPPSGQPIVCPNGSSTC